MTLSSLTERLRAHGIPNPEVDARLLLSHFMGISAAMLLANGAREYESTALEEAIKRRLSREPLQHILGEVAFYGELYEVSGDCLIPRADTELLVEEAIRLLPKGAHFADLCTGSGCIAISVLAHRADLSADAVDISPAALAVAQRNARKNGVSDRVRFLLENVLSPKTKEKRRYDAILSNPPYIRTDVIPTLAPELAYEPRLALDGGENGLCFYDALLSHYEAPLFLLEIGFDQGKDVLSLSKERGFDATVLRDAGGCDRLAVLQKK